MRFCEGIEIKFEGNCRVHWTEDVTERTGEGDNQQSRTVKKDIVEEQNYVRASKMEYPGMPNGKMDCLS